MLGQLSAIHPAFASLWSTQEAMGEVWLGTGSWDSEYFLGSTKICVMERKSICSQDSLIESWE